MKYRVIAVVFFWNGVNWPSGSLVDLQPAEAQPFLGTELEEVSSEELTKPDPGKIEHPES